MLTVYSPHLTLYCTEKAAFQFLKELVGARQSQHYAVIKRPLAVYYVTGLVSSATWTERYQVEVGFLQSQY